MAVTALSTKPSTPNPIRPPLIPSEKHSTEAKLRTKEITSSSSSDTQLRTPSPLATTIRSISVSFQGQAFSFQVTRSKPPAKTRKPRSLDSAGFDAEKVKRAAFDTEDLCLSSDSDSLSSGGSQEMKVRSRGRPTPRGIVVPARFLREKGGGGPLVSPRIVAPSIKRKESPTVAGNGGAGKPGNAPPSMLNFAAEARRGKRGEGLIEEAHALRLMHNRYLQWRYVNARADATLWERRRNAEENLYNSSITLSKMRDFVTLKGLELQLLTQDMKLISILKDQMIYLEDWSLVERVHYNSLSGTIGALKASTVLLPIVGGARAGIQELQSAIGSAINVMQAIGTPICSLLSKAEGATALLSEVVKTVALELALLDQSKDLLSKVSDMHVKQCSLQGHILQLNRETRRMQL